jgi:copper(I)-binding protein
MTTLQKILVLASVAATTVLAPNSWAQTTVQDAWVRGTVAQQKATGAFMQITSAQGGKLVAVATPVAGVAEIHEMKMEGSVMKMAAVSALELPAGKAVWLKPGGYHLMLMELKQALKEGDSVPLTLTVQGMDGKKELVELKLPVKALGMAAPAAALHEGHEGMKH